MCILLYRVKAPYSPLHCMGADTSALRAGSGSRVHHTLPSLTVITSLWGNAPISLPSSYIPASEAFYYCMSGSFSVDIYRKKLSPQPDGGASVHRDEPRGILVRHPDHINPIVAGGSFHVQVEMIWEPQNITQAWPGGTEAAAAAAGAGGGSSITQGPPSSAGRSLGWAAPCGTPTEPFWMVPRSQTERRPRQRASKESGGAWGKKNNALDRSISGG